MPMKDWIPVMIARKLTQLKKPIDTLHNNYLNHYRVLQNTHVRMHDCVTLISYKYYICMSK